MSKELVLKQCSICDVKASIQESVTGCYGFNCSGSMEIVSEERQTKALKKKARKMYGLGAGEQAQVGMHIR